jgi:hypothetical protein
MPRPGTPDFKKELSKKGSVESLPPKEAFFAVDSRASEEPSSSSDSPKKRAVALFEGRWREVVVEYQLTSGTHVRFIEDGSAWFIPCELMSSLLKIGHRHSPSSISPIIITNNKKNSPISLENNKQTEKQEQDHTHKGTSDITVVKVVSASEELVCASSDTTTTTIIAPAGGDEPQLSQQQPKHLSTTKEEKSDHQSSQDDDDDDDDDDDRSDDDDKEEEDEDDEDDLLDDDDDDDDDDEEEDVPANSSPPPSSSSSSHKPMKRKFSRTANEAGGLPLAAIQAAAAAVSTNSDVIQKRLKASAQSFVTQQSSHPVSQKSFFRVTSFVRKLYDIFSNEDFQPDIAYWNTEGDTIFFKSKEILEKNILPLYFKHCNARSLARQLNSYCFTKVFAPSATIAFRHPLFLRGRKDLLHLITRKDNRKHGIGSGNGGRGVGMGASFDETDNEEDFYPSPMPMPIPLMPASTATTFMSHQQQQQQQQQQQNFQQFQQFQLQQHQQQRGLGGLNMPSLPTGAAYNAPNHSSSFQHYHHHPTSRVYGEYEHLDGLGGNNGSALPSSSSSSFHHGLGLGLPSWNSSSSGTTNMLSGPPHQNNGGFSISSSSLSRGLHPSSSTKPTSSSVEGSSSSSDGHQNHHRLLGGVGLAHTLSSSNQPSSSQHQSSNGATSAAAAVSGSTSGGNPKSSVVQLGLNNQRSAIPSTSPSPPSSSSSTSSPHPGTLTSFDQAPIVISALLEELHRLRTANVMLESDLEHHRRMLEMSHQSQSKLQITLDQAWLERDTARLHASLMASLPHASSSSNNHQQQQQQHYRPSSV